MRILRRLLLVTVTLLGAAFALPMSVGGATGYVRTYGNSMEPAFHAGDLAVVRAAGSYHVGDVVAYRSPQLDRVVLHRIIDRNVGTFVFQGDNNDFRDAEHLDATHIVGRLALRVPRGGAALAWLTDPVHAVGVAVGASAASAIASRQRRRPHEDPFTSRGIPMRPATLSRFRAARLWLAVAGTALVLVAGLASTRPATQLVDQPVAFTHTGSFTYSASTSSALYPDGFTTGDPVFTRLADRVTIGFAHDIRSGSTMALTGTVAVDATLTGPGGWARTVPLVGTLPLEPDETTVRFVLDLPALHALAAEAATITGTPAGELRLTVTPTIDITGIIAGTAVADRFQPTLDLTLDATALRLAAPVDAGTDQITQTRPGTVTVTASEQAVVPLPIAGPELTVSAARLVGFVGGTTLLIAAAALSYAGRRRVDSKPARIAARYGHLLVPVTDSGNRHRPAVDVASIADLVRVAKHHDQLILHHAADDRDTYTVEVQGTAYRYTHSDGRQTDAAPDLDIAPSRRGTRNVAAHTRPRRRRLGVRRARRSDNA